MKLTDLTARELRIISESIASQIDDLNAQIKAAKKYIPDYMVESVTQKDRDALPVLREFHVQLLTATQIVKGIETVSSN